MNVISGKDIPRVDEPPEGYRRLDKKLAESYGLGYRALYNRVKEGKIRGVVQGKGKRGPLYLPPEIGIPPARARITPEVRERILEALRAGRKPAAIAHRERVGESTVYAIKEQHYEALAEGEQRRREFLEALNDLPLIAGINMGRGPNESVYVRATNLAAADQEVLGQLVEVSGYVDPSRNVFYFPPKQVREIAAWEDARRKRLEEIRSSAMIEAGEEAPRKD